MRITIKQALNQAQSRFSEAGIDSAALDSRLLIASALGERIERLIGYPEQEIKADQQKLIETSIERRLNREPVSHILGRREFWGMEFYINKNVLDPRPDSETLIDAVLRNIGDRQRALNILDFGTGSGCLLISLLKEYPNARGLGVDISEEALVVAKQNAQKLGMADRAGFEISDWGKNLSGRFDLIISNPPYIAQAEISTLEPEVAKFEPNLALDGGKDGLAAYRIIIPYIRQLLKANGIAALEFGAGQGDDIRHIAENEGLKVAESAKDLAGIERCLVLVVNDEAVKP